jgi:hypothetical protein
MYIRIALSWGFGRFWERSLDATMINMRLQRAGLTVTLTLSSWISW